MTRRARTLAGTALAALLVTGSLIVNTDSTAAQWQAAADLSGTGTITTGSLGFQQPSQTNSYGYYFLYIPVTETTFTGNIIEIDQAYWEWVSLRVTVAPELHGTGGLGAVLQANFTWPASYSDPRQEWSTILVEADYAVGTATTTTALTTTGTIQNINDGVTMQVLLWPTGQNLPAGWTGATVRFDGNPPTITFRLRIENRGHDYDWVIGSTGVQTTSPYRPVNPVGGDLTVTLRQMGADGTFGPWTHSSALLLPTVYNSYNTSGVGGVQVAGEVDGADQTADGPVPALEDDDPVPAPEDSDETAPEAPTPNAPDTGPADELLPVDEVG